MVAEIATAYRMSFMTVENKFRIFSGLITVQNWCDRIIFIFYKRIQKYDF